MLVHEKLGEGGSGNIDKLQQNRDIPKDISDKLQKLGFQMDSATFSRIQSANQQESFIKDLSAALINPAEKGRIEQLYLKGFGQVVTLKNGKTMSFSEILKLSGTEKDELINQLTRADKIKVQEFEYVASNQEEKRMDRTIEASNQRIEEKRSISEASNQEGKELDKQLIEMDGKLKDQIINLQNIQGVPKPDKSELLKTAKDIPELQNAKAADIERGVYDNIILANYYVNNAKDISKGLNPNDIKKFENSIHGISDTMGRKRITNWPEIVETRGGLVLGERREEIRSLGERYIRDGYDESVVWDSQSRSLIFRGKNGEKIIDTAPIPPEERITEAGISISREAPPVALSPSRLSHQKTERSIISELDTMSQNDATRGRIDTTLQAKIDRGFDRAKMSPDTTDKLDATNDALTHKKTALEQLIQYYKEKGEGAEANALESNLSIVNSQIRKIADMRATYEKSLEALRTDDTGTSSDNFDSIARTNLDWLTSEDTLFQRMGPIANRALYRIIDMINQYRDPANQISLSKSILDITDKQNLQAGYQKLGGDMSTLRDGEKIRDFQQQISAAVEKPVGAPGSIEALLMATSDTKPKTPEKSVKNI